MKSILLGVTLGTRKFLMTLILICLLSVGDTQTSCNKHCINGHPVFDADGNCICQCVLRYRGKRCDKLPNCGNKTCGKVGSLRGDCECYCPRMYIGERCQTMRCPYSDHPVCGRPGFADCTLLANTQECPYMCRTCQESQKPKLENNTHLHISQYGCIFQGTRPSKEMCKTLGNNGDDKMSCFDESDVDKNCRRCNNGGRHALVNCPVMCALCDKPEISTTTARVTSFNTNGQNKEMTSLTRNVTHVHQGKQTQRNSQLFGSAVIAAIVLGVVLCVVVAAVIVLAVIFTRRYSSMKRAVQSRGKVSDHCYENSNTVNRNEHYVTVDSVEDETNSKYEMLSIDNSAERSNNRGHEYNDATPGL